MSLTHQIREHLREAYLSRNWCVAWPDQFVDAGLGDLDEVVSALKVLVREGVVTVSLEVRCAAEGHHLATLQEGQDVDLHGWDCDRCDSNEDEGEVDLYLRFELTDEFRAPLDEKKKRQVA